MTTIRIAFFFFFVDSKRRDDSESTEKVFLIELKIGLHINNFKYYKRTWTNYRSPISTFIPVLEHVFNSLSPQMTVSVRELAWNNNEKNGIFRCL